MQFDVYTMGFSNRNWDETVDILSAYHIKRLVDIRTLPGSKHTPQFNLEHLQAALPKAGIEYVHLKSLGGLHKRGVEKRLISRLCRLHADAGIRASHRRARQASKGKHYGLLLYRGCFLAMPSPAGIGCSVGARLSRRAYLQRHQSGRALIHEICEGRRNNAHVS